MLNLTHSHLAQVRQERERVSYPFPEIFFSITIFLTFDIDIVSSSCSTVLLSLQYFFLTISVSSLSIFAFFPLRFFFIELERKFHLLFLHGYDNSFCEIAWKMSTIFTDEMILRHLHVNKKPWHMKCNNPYKTISKTKIKQHKTKLT